MGATRDTCPLTASTVTLVLRASLEIGSIMPLVWGASSLSSASTGILSVVNSGWSAVRLVDTGKPWCKGLEGEGRRTEREREEFRWI